MFELFNFSNFSSVLYCVFSISFESLIISGVTFFPFVSFISFISSTSFISFISIVTFFDSLLFICSIVFSEVFSLY